MEIIMVETVEVAFEVEVEAEKDLLKINEHRKRLRNPKVYRKEGSIGRKLLRRRKITNQMVRKDIKKCLTLSL